MAGFSLKKNLNEVEYRRVRIASQAYTRGDAVMKDTAADAVDVIPATSASTHENIIGIAMETVISTATSLLIAIIEPSQTWECATVNTVASNDNYQNMVLTDKATVNNTNTDSTTGSALVQQVGVSGTKGLFQFRGAN